MSRKRGEHGLEHEAASKINHHCRHEHYAIHKRFLICKRPLDHILGSIPQPHAHCRAYEQKNCVSKKRLHLIRCERYGQLIETSAPYQRHADNTYKTCHRCRCWGNIYILCHPCRNRKRRHYRNGSKRHRHTGYIYPVIALKFPLEHICNSVKHLEDTHCHD